MSTYEDLFDRRYFPTLKSNPELLYFDSASTTHTHRWVVDRMNKFYKEERCTVHRSDNSISNNIAEEIELCRSRVAHLINAQSDQILFTTGATQGLNWLADWYKNIGTVIITEAEHNANVLPWLAQGRTVGNGLEILPLQFNNGPMPSIDLNRAIDIFNKHQGNALLSMCTHSNVLGTAIGYAPYQNISHEAKRCGIAVALDACQTVGHLPLDVKEFDADWVVFSAHKMYGPMGIGAIYAKQGADKLRPINYGGGQVEHLSLKDVIFATGSYKHEVGTPNIPAILGFGVAAELINYVGYDHIIKKEINASNALMSEGVIDNNLMSQMECVAFNKFGTIMGQTSIPGCQNIYSFVTQPHPSDIGTLLGQKNVVVRSGKLCAHLLSTHYSDKGLLRISVGPYTTMQDCRQLSSILNEVLADLY